MFAHIEKNLSQERLIKKSRFICQIGRVSTNEEAVAFINRIKKEHPKANHSCFAYVLGDSQNIQRASDDGEPAGTAGAPMLEVLVRQNLTDLCAVVTRYFGGVKLGSSGLIRAYSGSVSETLADATFVKFVNQQGLLLTLDYAYYDSLHRFLTEQNILLTNKTFDERAHVEVFVDEAALAAFLDLLTEQFSGKIVTQETSVQSVEKPIF